MAAVAPGPWQVVVGSMLYAAVVGIHYRKMKKGLITKKQFKKFAGRTGAGLVGAISGIIAGSFAGFALGQVIIPVPILGGVIGCVLGSVSGSLAGSALGNKVHDKIETKIRKRNLLKQMEQVKQANEAHEMMNGEYEGLVGGTTPTGINEDEEDDQLLHRMTINDQNNDQEANSALM